MQTYQVSAEIYEECNSWPLTCIHCGGLEIIYSPFKHDSLCEECGCWQLTEEEE